ncbi:MAG: hypothetical protein IJ043_05875 [Clostridia bacterium]|nr:hypothetical protein [Clostridia bacterium]
MFDTLLDTITSIVGVTILLFSAISIVMLFTKSLVCKHLIKLSGIIIYILFIVGCTFFKEYVEITFNIAFVTALSVVAIIALIYFIKQTKNTSKIMLLQSETERQCRNCELYEECENYYKPNCLHYKPIEEIEE